MIHLQDFILNQVRKNQIPVTIFLVNGVQLRGQIKGFDRFAIVLQTNGKQQMIYKQALSTIQLETPVPIE